VLDDEAGDRPARAERRLDRAALARQQLRDRLGERTCRPP
jgi:hypothetical protein